MAMEAMEEDQPSSSQPRKRKTKPSSQEQHSQSKRARATSDDEFDNEENVVGKIKRVFVKNFMCHDAMEVNFNSKVNFIVGANGSGKSAILTALTVGLGAAARATKRGSSINAFIKKGKNTATVEITVTNEGPMAYKFETYGDSITVVRNIGASSSYKIKNWRGDVVSTKKEELIRIVNYLNIQVENPISVLNQDVSRTFLTTTDPREKYNLFMKATRLDVIQDNYSKALVSSDTAKKHLNDAKMFLSENEKQINELQKKLKSLASLDNARAEQDELQKELPWAAVVQEEQKLLQLENKIKIQQEKLQELESKENEKALKEQKIESQIEDLKKEITEMECKAADGNLKLSDLKKQTAEAKRLFDEKKERVRNHHKNIKRDEENIVTLRDEIQKLEKANSAADGKKCIAKEQNAALEQKLDEIDATLRTKQTDLMHLEESKRRLEKDEYQIGIHVDQKRSELNRIRQKLTALRNQPNDALTVFGASMPRLLKRIEEEHNRGRFRQKPVGPLGAFIKMKDSTWIPAVENHLGFGTLSSFCVDNAADAKILNVIMQEVFRGENPPQVIISRFFNKTHNVEKGCARSPNYWNLLDAMEISHPVVANCLIDQREIECVLLIPTSSEACNVMSDARQVPRNCKRAITKQADLFYPDPNYRTYGGSVKGARFLQVSASDAIKTHQEEMSVCEDELKIAQAEQKEIIEKKRKNFSESSQVDRLVKDLLRKQTETKNKIEENREIIESCNDANINTFMSEMEELQRLVVQKKEQKCHMMDELRQTQKDYETIEKDLNYHRDLAQNLEATLNPFKEKIRELKDEKNRLRMSNQNATRRIEEAKQILQRSEGEHQQQQRVVNSKIEVAEKACSRMNTKKSMIDINQRIKELKIMIETVERQHGSKEDLEAELNEKLEKFQEVRDFAIELSRTNDKQLKRLKTRELIYHEMKKFISKKIQDSFSNILTLRNYKGKVTIDHLNKDLKLEVSPKNDVKRPTNDAKALSGGERSYSTVAFILALWDSVGLPFYFLDEFDVFMDKINRRMIMDILLSHAKEHPQNQFTFLTPLDTSHIIADNSITIHRLAAPERSA